MRRIAVREYLAGPEQTRPLELVWGVLHEPPAPRYGHQSVVVRTVCILDEHVRGRGLGQVCVAPADVVLDEKAGLAVQPDVFFVSNERAGIIREVVWGAPDLVIEVASRPSVLRDRTTKLGWYRAYGVRECWLVDPGRRLLVVVDLKRRGRSAFDHCRDNDPVRSAVLPELHPPAAAFFG